jgi:Ni,Fe-hydrogenase III large subunit
MQRNQTPDAQSNFKVRMKEISAQEKLIEQKKKEIEQKLLSAKMRNQEEALSKMAPTAKSSPSAKSFTGNKM